MPGKGLLIVFTGNGKGKTTAALGVALRAVGHGFKVLMIQFIKGPWPSGELEAATRLGDSFEIRPMGGGFVKTAPRGPDPSDIARARQAWQAAVEAIQSGKYDILILDEINYAVDYGLIPLEQMLEALRNRPEKLHVICTGRNAAAELSEAADVVTEMKEIKHPFASGRRAEKGIDF